MMKKIIKLYLKEHLSFIATALFSTFVISTSLTLLEHDLNYFYLGILYFFVLSVGMGIHFYRNIPLYKSLLSDIHSEEDFFVFGNSPLAKEERNRMQSIRSVYKKDVHQLRKESKNGKLVISKWVHQMKTPLSVLNLMAQEKSMIPSDELLEEVSRMEYLLDQILHLTRMDNIKNDFIVERCQLSQLVKHAINEQKNYFIQKEVFPKMDIPDSVYVYTDKKWFSFAIQQFLNNAVKYSDPGQKILISSAQAHRAFILKIQDFGSGILPEDQPRIFDFCYTGNNGRKKENESSGLGLYISKNILDYLGHTIILDSKPGIGTTFQIFLQADNV